MHTLLSERISLSGIYDLIPSSEISAEFRRKGYDTQSWSAVHPNTLNALIMQARREHPSIGSAHAFIAGRVLQAARHPSNGSQSSGSSGSRGHSSYNSDDRLIGPL
jgi:hypothetical protein